MRSETSSSLIARICFLGITILSAYCVFTTMFSGELDFWSVPVMLPSWKKSMETPSTGLLTSARFAPAHQLHVPVDGTGGFSTYERSS